MGTLHYMSPEVIGGNPTVEWAALSDIWGLGVVVHELLTGVTPFHHESRNITKANILEAKLSMIPLTDRNISFQVLMLV